MDSINLIVRKLIQSFSLNFSTKKYVNFLGSPKLSRLIELRGKHGRDQDRWIYYAVDVNDGTVYPNVGVGNTEKTFNINIEKTKELK